MARTILRSLEASRTMAGPFLIAVGLSGLVAEAWFPGIPVVTAMAILTLGATTATLARFRTSAALPAILLTHSATYFSLYALFIGAILQAAVASPSHGLSAGQEFDLAASILPMALAARAIVATLRPQFGPQR